MASTYNSILYKPKTWDQRLLGALNPVNVFNVLGCEGSLSGRMVNNARMRARHKRRKRGVHRYENDSDEESGDEGTGDGDGKSKSRSNFGQNRDYKKIVKASIKSFANISQNGSEAEFFESDDDKGLKMLILGSGDAGKTCFYRQLCGGATEEIRQMSKKYIRANLVIAAQTLVKVSSELLPPVALGKVALSLKNSILEVSPDEKFTKKLAEDIAQLWKDSGVQQVYSRRGEFYLHENTGHFMAKAVQIANDDWIPTPVDSLKTGTPTDGKHERELELFGKEGFTVVDAGGKRKVRKSWAGLFPGTTILVFVVGVSEYDQVLEEDEKTNRLNDSLALWEEMVNTRWFVDSQMCLVFTKLDIFKKKIMTKPLSVWDKKAPTGSDEKKALAYIENKFKEKIQDKRRKVVICHLNVTEKLCVKKFVKAVEGPLKPYLAEYD